MGQMGLDVRGQAADREGCVLRGWQGCWLSCRVLGKDQAGEGCVGFTLGHPRGAASWVLGLEFVASWSSCK